MSFYMRIITLLSFFLLFTAVTLSGRDLKLGINN